MFSSDLRTRVKRLEYDLRQIRDTLRYQEGYYNDLLNDFNALLKHLHVGFVDHGRNLETRKNNVVKE